MSLTHAWRVDKLRIFPTSARCVHTERMGLESMRIVTGCRTAEQFITAFHRFCDAKTCFIPSVDTRPIGSTLAFSLRLADGTPMLRGTCVVKAAWKTKDNQFKRPGVQLEITKLSAESAALYEHMLAQKTAVIVKSDDDSPTQPVVVVVPPPPAPSPPAETRAPGSAIVLPANPLFDLDDRVLDEILGCTLSEDADTAKDDDLAIPVEEPAPLPLPPTREGIATLLGVAPLVPPARPARAVARKITQPLVLDARPPARRSTTATFALPHERFWLVCMVGAAVLVTLVVLTSAFVFWTT